MFSLIATLISIALVAALALASLYYGGPVFNQGAARAHAAKIAAQGQQLQGAAELYKANTGEYPISLAELVAQDYLKSIPVASAQEQVLINNALAASTWVMVAPKTPVFALTGVTEAVCKAINLGSYGVEGILKTARESNRVQCYGTDLSNLMIVQAKAPADLVAASTNPAAVIQVGTVLTAPVPAADSTDTSNAGWLVAPGTGTPVVTPPAAPQVTYLDTSLKALSTLAFPPTNVGETSASMSVVVKNTGTASITFSAQGASVPAPYNEVSDTCASVTLAPNSTCTVGVTFAPTAATAYTGESYAITLASADAAVTSTVALSGAGTAVQSLAGCVVLDKAYSEGSFPSYKNYLMANGEIAGSIGSEVNAHWGWIDLTYVNQCAGSILVGNDIVVQALPANSEDLLNSSSYLTEDNHPFIFSESLNASGQVINTTSPYIPTRAVGTINAYTRDSGDPIPAARSYVTVAVTNLDVAGWDVPTRDQTVYSDLGRIRVTVPLSNNGGVNWSTATYTYVVNKNYTYNK